MFRSNRISLYGACALSWLFPFPLEYHVALTFALFMFHEVERIHQREKVEPEPEVPHTARTLGMVQMICEMEITDNV